MVIMVKKRVKFALEQGHERPEGQQLYSLTSALDGGWVVNARPLAALRPGNNGSIGTEAKGVRLTIKYILPYTVHSVG